MITGLIIADSHEQARNWVVENNLMHQDYKYISNIESYFGYHNIPIFLVGNYYNNPAFAHLVAFGAINYLQDNFENLPPSGVGKEYKVVWNKNKFVTEKKS